MNPDQPVDETVSPTARIPIYERLRSAATRRDAGGTLLAATGAVVGAAFWLTASLLGFPQIFGLGSVSFLPVAIVAGAVAGITRVARFMVLATAALLLLLLIVAFTPIMESPTDRLVRRDVAPSTADAIVVLSAGVTMDGMLTQQGLDRILKGVELARAGVAPRIVLTRERKTADGRLITSDLDQTRLVALAEAPVTRTETVASTRDEALRIKEMSDSAGWKRIVLVTSPFHSRRACATFEKVGMAVSCMPAESRDVAVINLTGRDDRVRAFGMWTYELAGTLRYWIAGWM
jgi:uncharacterized SAM-binding protein YcdF (DUF218 family)